MMSEQKETPVVMMDKEMKKDEKISKPMSPEQYMKGLEKFHRQTKLEAEIAEYQFRRLMALNQMQNFRAQQLAGQEHQEPVSNPNDGSGNEELPEDNDVTSSSEDEDTKVD